MMEWFKNIKISDYTYQLPVNKIAQFPINERDHSKLLVFNKQRISSDYFYNIGNYLKNNSLLIVNNSKVIFARFHLKKDSGAAIEVFCLEPVSPNEYNQAFNQKNTCIWKCLVRNLKKWKSGTISAEKEIENKLIRLEAVLLKKGTDSHEIEFRWNNHEKTFGEIMEIFGQIPLPPYISRESNPDDEIRYQTVYSSFPGSVAAPTAGLHFSDRLMKNLLESGIKVGEITLHVGAGTFKPVKSETIGPHQMHSEQFSVSVDFLNLVCNNLENLVVVGTTSVRAIESLYWIGVKLKTQSLQDFYISQWEPYLLPQNIPVIESFKSIIDYCKKQHIKSIFATTQIIIVPGYKFRLTKTLITNFHQPSSTLLLLVAAFTDNYWKDIYQYALDNNFRFLSYGDSSLLIP